MMNTTLMPGSSRSSRRMNGRKRLYALVVALAGMLATTAVAAPGGPHGPNNPGGTPPDTTTTVNFNPDPATVGSPVEIIGSVVVTSGGAAVTGGKIQLSEFVDADGNGVPCGTANAQTNGLNGGGDDVSASGIASVSIIYPDPSPYDRIGFQAHYVPTGSGFGESMSECANLEVGGGFADMPVNKLINGISAVCDDPYTGGTDESGLGEGTGNNIGQRPCTYSTDNSTPSTIKNTVFLTLGLDDPRFDINVYTTVNGSPGVTINPDSNLNGLSFPQPGIKIAPQFDTEIPWGTAFTMCELQAAPYALTGVTVKANGITQGIPNIYFVSGTLPGETQERMFACFNTSGPPTGTNTFSIDLDNSTVCSYTQGAYGQDNGNNAIGQILSDNFLTVFPDGVQVGDRTTIGSLDGNPPNGWGLLFTTAGAVRDFLPQGGAGGILDNDYLNPTTTPADEFGGQVTSLQINTDLGDANVFPGGGGGIGDFLVTYLACYPSSTPSVREVLEDANFVISGAAGSPPNGASCSLSDLNNLVTKLNQSFDNCSIGSDAVILSVPVSEE
jgi:hypothetical protein